MKNILDFMQVVDEYQSYLVEKGVKFTSEGWPLMEREWFAENIPDKIVPYLKRTDRRIKQYKSVAICFYTSDDEIYPRLENVLENIEEYRKYEAVIESDLTVTWDMDEEWQNIIILTNQLFMAILAVNGIKVIVNTRIGVVDDFSSLRYIPHGVICASGFLGCDRSSENDVAYITKILFLRPSNLLIYGKCSSNEIDQLDRFGIRYRVYKDYHSWSKKVGGKDGR